MKNKNIQIEICPECGVVYDPVINGFCPLCLVMDHRLLKKMVAEKATKPDDIDLEEMNEILEYTRKFGLEAEVIISAFLALKNDPTLSISEALSIGQDEWIK